MLENRWCVGFMFDRARQNVVLIQRDATSKMFPDVLNGIGGGVESTETPLQAMHRECEEEAGVLKRRLSWVHYATLEVAVPTPGLLYCFWAEHWNPDELDGHVVPDEGVLKVIGVGQIHISSFNLVPNCNYLIPMALDTDQPFAQIREAGVEASSKLLNLGFETEANGTLILVDQDDGRKIRNQMMLYDDEPSGGIVANVEVYWPGYVHLTIRLLLRMGAVAGMFTAEKQPGQLDLPLQEGDTFKVYNELPEDEFP